MSSPYATVILPTLNRHATLPFAVQSVLSQSETSLELLLVLDGATQRCRAVAEHAASSDPRVRVLDLPKAPANGERNTEFAVNQARADRIFYVDDDDLLLPNHIAVLGQALDHADVADSRLCSADRSDRLHLGVARASNSRIRRYLGHFELKMLYDTHFAHRKNAFGRFSNWVPAQGEGQRPVWEFFSGFANNQDCRWASVDQVTAINLHGAARRDMSSESRADEIKVWLSRVCDAESLDSALSDASTGFNLFRLLLNAPPGECSLAQYLHRHGGYDDTENQQNQTIFNLMAGVKPTDTHAIELAALSAEIVESGYWSQQVAEQFCRVFGVDRSVMLFSCAQKSSTNQAGNLFALSVIESKRDRPEAVRLAQAACDLGPDPINMLQQWCSFLVQSTG